MPRNGSGTYSLYTPGNPVVTGTTISSTWANNTLNDISTALTNSIAKDGQTTPTANLPMGTFKFTGLGSGSSATDSLNLGQAQAEAYLLIGSISGTDTIVGNLSPAITAYAAGQAFKFVAANTNTGAVTINIDGLGAKSITKNGSASLVAGDILQNGVAHIVYDGTRFQLANPVTISTTGLSAATVANVPMINGYIEWSTSGNALTAALKTSAGTDPSATDPVLMIFRNATLGTAGYLVRSITSALSVTASSGSTLGTVSAQASRIRCVGVDTGSGVVLGLYNTWNNSALSLKGIDEGAVYSTTAEGGAGAADSAQVIYTTAAQTSKPVRELGYVESTQTTAGTWAQALDRKVTAGVGYTRTGAIVQNAYTLDGAVATGNTVIPWDDTIPQQSTDGNQYMSVSITPYASSNILQVEWLGNFANNAATNQLTVALFQDSTENALAANSTLISAGNASQPGISTGFYQKVSGTTSSTTFKLKAGGNAASTTTFNGSAGARKLGGSHGSFMTVKEIFV